MTVVAAVDCGTNSIRLLIAEVENGRLHDRERIMRIVRLGEGVDRTGRLGSDALQRTFAAIDDYADRIKSHDVEACRFVATSATRDASNASEFVAGVRQRLDVVPEVVSGQEEAGLSYRGALSSPAVADAVVGSGRPGLVVDIGGGSTEFVTEVDGVLRAYSADIGCVRMTERFLLGDPPGGEQVAAARNHIRHNVTRALTAIDCPDDVVLVGLAGSVTTVAALALGLDHYDAQRINGSRISAGAVRDWADRLLSMSRQDRSDLTVMHPGRVDVIGGGALILEAVVAALDTRQVLVSEYDILDGIALSVAGHLQ